MTAYLQRGDRIHLAIPAVVGLPGLATDREQRELQAFAAQGVTVVRYWTCSDIEHPVVYAVFRDPPAGRRRRRGK